MKKRDQVYNWPVKVGIHPIESVAAEVDAQTIGPPKLVTPYSGDIGSVSVRSGNVRRLHGIAQPVGEEKVAVIKNIQNFTYVIILFLFFVQVYCAQECIHIKLVHSFPSPYPSQNILTYRLEIYYLKTNSLCLPGITET